MSEDDVTSTAEAVRSGAATALDEERAGDRLVAAGLPVTDLRPALEGQEDPLLFATVSGAHLYGFPSRDSDVDLRGVHLLPVGGFANTQWRLFEKTGELKPLLYTFRVLLTGIHLMRAGEVQAHLPTLLGEVAAPGYLPELIAAKADVEHAEVRGPGPESLGADVRALHAVLDAAQRDSALPAAPTGFDALHDLVVRARLER
jgi:predicted nucleotidyltransferase